MNMYNASGKPVESPVNPPVKWAQENGTPERSRRRSTRMATQTTIITTIWAMRATPTAAVESFTPFAVTQIAAVVRIRVRGPQGTFTEV